MKNIDSYTPITHAYAHYQNDKAVQSDSRVPQAAYCAVELRVEWHGVAEAEECLTHLDAKVKVKV